VNVTADELAGPPLPSPAGGRRLDIGDASGIDSEALTQSSVTDPDDLAAPPVACGTAFHPESAATDGNSYGSASDLPADPSSVWQSQSSRRTSQLVMVVMLAVFGLVAATVGFVQFARSFTGKSTVSESDVLAQNDGELATQTPDPRTTSPDVPEPVTETPKEPPSPETAETETDTSQPPIPRGEEEPQRASPIVDPAATEPTPAAVEPVTVAPVPMGPAISAAPIADDGTAAMDDLPAGLRKFVPLLDVSTADNGAPQTFATPPTIDSVQLDAAAEIETEETPTVKRASIDVPKLLAMRFAIDNRGGNLSELMLLASQLTGVPIELELISIDLAGISINQPLTTPSGWMSMEQWLQQSLASVGLVMEIGDGVVLVHASAPRLLEASGHALMLDDFGDDAERIAGWIKPIVIPNIGAAVEPAAPANEEEVPQPDGNVNENDEAKPTEPWSFDAAEKRLVVPADRYLLVQSICAAEAMRLMSGKPTKLPRMQTARWIGRWTTAKQPTKDPSTITDWPVVTDGQAGAQLDSPRTIAGLLRRVATENRAAVAVVWHDAMRHQIYPTDLAMPLSDGLTAGAYIDDLIGEGGLQARDTGDSVWWIGSEGLYDRYEVITWMTIPAGTGASIAQRLSVTLGVADPAMLPITWDQSTLMIRAPRYIARQLQRFIVPQSL
jgi:hypothetical protein